MKQRFLINLLLISLVTLSQLSYSRLPTSRDSDFAENLSPCKIININLLNTINNTLSSMTDKICDLVDIKQYETTFKGGLGVCNLGGPNHDDETTKCWTHPLHITTSNPTFEGINIIRIKENITFKPNANTSCPEVPAQAAIIVEKDDMTIDLSGFAIVMDGQNLIPNPPTICRTLTGCVDPGCIAAVHGIYIKPGIKNTRIISSQDQNTHTRGSLKKFTGFGIYIDGGTTSTTRIEEVFINNIRIYNCYNGIFGQHASNINVTRTEANNNCNFNTVYGMQFVDVAELYIIGSQASSNQSCNNVYGIYLEDTCNSHIEETQTNKNRSIATGSVHGIHITATSPTTSFTNTIKNCICSSNSCSADSSAECVGIFLGSTNTSTHEGTAHNVIQDCTIMANNFAETSSPPQAHGIKSDHANFNEITNNKVGFNGNTSSTGSINYGIIDTVTAGSTNLFTSNVSFFNGYQGNDNYSITFKKNNGGVEEFKATIIYAANLEGVATNTPNLGNVDVRKAP